jgi:hypothetical protein
VDNELRHGTWWDRWRGVSPQNLPRDAMEGRFGRLFPQVDSPPWSNDDLKQLADAMTAPLEDPPTPEGQVDAEENSGIAAAYTYLGQFIDHDLTLDPTSHLRVFARNVNDLVDFRTPRFDLDCVYGRGPSDQPYLYRPDGAHLLQGSPLSGNPHDPGATDLPRGPNGRALIGDPRNDENRIIAQLQSTMLRFHNRMADVLQISDFEAVRAQVRWHYQWIVVNDFLPTVINQQTVRSVFPHLAGGSIADKPPNVRIDALKHDRFFMPVEFSVAAYRFGHSMIRPIYRLNPTITRRTIFSTAEDVAGDLGGMRPIPDDWAIDWQFFLDLDHGAQPEVIGGGVDQIIRQPQQSYKIDTSLVNPLAKLPARIAANPSALAERNLQRGRDFLLPTGQRVAELLGEAVLSDQELVIGKATSDPTDPKTPIASIAPSFAGHAPLWTYILAEAQVTSLRAPAGGGGADAIPIRLGPVGGRLVAEVFAALLKADPTSYLVANPRFTPRPEFTHDGVFGLAELINVALDRKP